MIAALENSIADYVGSLALDGDPAVHAGLPAGVETFPRVIVSVSSIAKTFSGANVWSVNVAVTLQTQMDGTNAQQDGGDFSGTYDRHVLNTEAIAEAMSEDAAGLATAISSATFVVDSADFDSAAKSVDEKRGLFVSVFDLDLKGQKI